LLQAGLRAFACTATAAPTAATATLPKSTEPAATSASQLHHNPAADNNNAAVATDTNTGNIFYSKHFLWQLPYATNNNNIQYLRQQYGARTVASPHATLPRPLQWLQQQHATLQQQFACSVDDLGALHVAHATATSSSAATATFSSTTAFAAGGGWQVHVSGKERSTASTAATTSHPLSVAVAAATAASTFTADASTTRRLPPAQQDTCHAPAAGHPQCSEP